MSEKDIWDALILKMDTFAAMRGIDIVIPNVTPYIRDNVPYLDCTIIKPEGTQRSEAYDRPILFQVAIMWPLGEGEEGAMVLADEIKAEFPVWSRVGGLKVMSKADVTQGYEDGPRWRVPVTVHLRGFF